MSIEDLAFSAFLEDIKINNDSLVVDLGAWKGEFSEWALSKGAKVIAYEPSGEFKLQHPNLTLIEKAVWIKDGKVKYKRTTGSGNMINSGDEEVDCVDIKDITEQKIDLLKVNIEGAEIEVLKRANISNINQILVEFHEWIGLVKKEDVDSLVRKIISTGYSIKGTPKHPDYLFTRI